MEEQVTLSLSGMCSTLPDRKKFRVSVRARISAVLVFFCLTAVSSPVFSGETPAEFTPENILAFTHYLIESGEYYRAGVELRRLEAYYPGYLPAEKYKAIEMYILFKGRRYSDMTRMYSGGAMDCVPSVFVIDSFMLTGDYAACKPVLESVYGICSDDLMREIIFKRKAGLDIINGSAYDPQTGELLAELSQYKVLADWAAARNSEKKSPLIGALLGLVPGMGYVYAGDTGTGFTALTVISIFGAVTYGSFQYGAEPLGILAGAVTLFFYGGNIAGGYLQTKKYNNAIDDQVRSRVRSELGMDGDIDRIYIRFGMSSNER